MNLAQLSLKCFSLLLPLLAISVTACQSLTIQPSPPAPEVRSDTQLVLNNAILQQSNQEDNTVWKIKADNIVYSEDKQTAALSQIVGNLWQDDSIILKVSAKRGKIKDNGNTILLNEEVIVSDPRNNSVINSDALEWRPQDNILLIEEALRGTHPNLEVTANSGIYLTDVEQLVVQGDVVATTDQPSLQLTSDRLEWSISQNKVNSPGAIKLARYDAAQNITEKLVSDRAEVDLIAHTATLNQNVELITAAPQLQIATELFIWNYQQRRGNAEKPIQILDREQQIVLTGNQGEINLQQQLAILDNGVKGINPQQDLELYAQKLTWKITANMLEATGNIVYQQASPPARLTGEKAVGNLSNNNIVVTGNGQKQVQTVIDN